MFFFSIALATTTVTTTSTTYETTKMDTTAAQPCKLLLKKNMLDCTGDGCLENGGFSIGLGCAYLCQEISFSVPVMCICLRLVAIPLSIGKHHDDACRRWFTALGKHMKSSNLHWVNMADYYLKSRWPTWNALNREKYPSQWRK